MVDNMTNLITALKAAALRKAHEPTPPNKSNVHTPQEFSRLKWEKEEKRKQMQLQHEQAMRALQQQRQIQGMQGQPGMPNAMPQQRTGTGTPGNTSVPVQMGNANSQAGHLANNPGMAARPHPAQQAMQANYPNGSLSGMPMNSSGVPQAQMQATMQNNQRMGPPNDQVRMAMQRAQYPATNQHQFQLQQQQINMASNITANMNMGNGMPNANMMGSMAGNMNAPMAGTANTAGSPRMNQVNPQMRSPAQQLSSGHVPQLLQWQNTLKKQHPEWSPEQVQKAASDHLQGFLQRQRAQAMTAAAGSGMTPGMTPSGMTSGMTPSGMTPSGMTPSNMTPSGISPSPQLGNNVYMPNGGVANSPSPNPVANYQTQLLQQQRMMSQQRQQQAGSPAMSAARPISRSATPQNPQQMGIQSPGTGSVAPPQQQQSRPT